MLTALRAAMPATLILLVLAACGGAAATPTIRPSATAALPTTAASSSAAASPGATDFTALCRTLESLSSLDYAYGKNFSAIQSLDAASKALTLQHVQAFATNAPPELQQAATDLVGLWTDLVNNPTSVTESDPRWTSAANSISAWRSANCK